MEVLFSFLNWAASFSVVDEESGSKMDIHNLATVVAPNMLFSNNKTEGMEESFLAIEAVHQLLECNELMCEVRICNTNYPSIPFGLHGTLLTSFARSPKISNPSSTIAPSSAPTPTSLPKRSSSAMANSLSATPAQRTLLTLATPRRLPPRTATRRSRPYRRTRHRRLSSLSSIRWMQLICTHLKRRIHNRRRCIIRRARHHKGMVCLGARMGFTV